jgi:hypothetical protein
MTVLRGIKPPDAKLSPLKLSLYKMAFRLNISFSLKKEAPTLGRGFSLAFARMPRAEARGGMVPFKFPSLDGRC